jgi:hypothetical protein
MTNNIGLSRLSWGWRIAALYLGFVTLIIFLVVKSSKQHFDLVSKDYYQQEISYQKVLDASKNQSALSPMEVHANAANVIIDLPSELVGKHIGGSVQFYSPIDAKWDKTVELVAVEGKVMIPRNILKNARYTMKINCVADGKSYYQESEINLY